MATVGTGIESGRGEVKTRGGVDVVRVAEIGLGGLWIWAGLSKISNPPEFLGAMNSYGLPLPEAGLRLGAMVMPWLELLLGILFALGAWVEAAWAVSVGLLAVFTVATAQAWVRGLPVSCGCLDLRWVGIEPGSRGAGWLTSAPAAIARNAILLGVCYWVRPQPLRLSQPTMEH